MATVAEQRAWRLYNELVQGSHQAPLKSVLLADGLDLFVKWKQSDGLSDKTCERSQICGNELITHLATEEIKNIGQVTLLSVDRYLQNRTNITASTRRNYACIFKQWFRYMFVRKLITENPLAEMKMPKVRHKQYPAVRLQQLRRILAAATGELANLLTFLAFTGMRSGEAVHLLVRNVDFADNVIRVRNTDIHTLKNENAVRDIPIHRNLKPLLVRVIGDRRQGRVFVQPTKVTCRKTNQFWTGEQVNDEFCALTLSLGLPTGQKNDGLTANALRRYFKTTCRDELIPESLVDRWCGHSVQGWISTTTTAQRASS